MKQVVNRNEMQCADRYTSKYYGLDEILLMERAALSVSDEITTHFPKESKILIVCGCGNNGADGIAIGRILLIRGYHVEITCIGDHVKSDALIHQINILTKYGYSYNNILLDKEYDIIIDALFGIGLSRQLQEPYLSVINDLNKRKSYRISIDISSGINSDTGIEMGASFHADMTYTFSFYKQGSLIFDGKENSGIMKLLPIGIEPCSLKNNKRNLYLLEKEDIKLPNRKDTSNKGTCGKLLIFAGNEDISGAAILSTTAAYRMGAGMVRIVTHENNRNIIATSVPEALITCYKDTLPITKLEDAFAWCDGILIGPGIGNDHIASEMLSYVLKQNKPIVIDADGINLLSKDSKLWNEFTAHDMNKIILTPHVAELSRLLGLSMDLLKTDYINNIMEWNEKYPVILIAKDARTLIGLEGKQYFINSSGCNALATAGTGDVLAGMLAGYIVQEKENVKNQQDAALFCTWFHGYLAEVAMEYNNEYSFMASDLFDQMKKVLGEMKNETL